MKKQTTLFRKGVLYFAIFPILSFFIFLLPWVVSGLAEVIPAPPYLKYFGFMGLYGAVVPFLFALYQSIKFLSYIKRNEIFSEFSVMVLRNIKYSTVTISFLYLIAMPLLYFVADKDDSPGILLFGLIIYSASTVAAFSAAFLEKKKR
jgi:hypothetical protein